VPDALSILPSTTMAAWATLFTGAGAARTGIPGNEWFAREEMRYYAPAPVSVEGHDHAVESFTDDLLGGVLRVPTVYERANVRTYVSLSHFHRGADLLIMPSADALADLVASAVAGLGEDDESVGQEAYEDLDSNAIDNLAGPSRSMASPTSRSSTSRAWTCSPTWPRIRSGSSAAISRRSSIPRSRRIIEIYRAAGALEDTYILFVSDHGHTPVLNDDRHALGIDGDDEPVAILRQAGFRLRPFKLELDDDEGDFQATVAFQGAFAYVYLADRSTCPAAGDVCDWVRGPRLEEDVLQVVRAFDAANRTGAGVPKLQGALDLILARTPRNANEDALPFQVWDGQRLVDVGEYLAANPRPDLLDFERRMTDLAAGPFGHRAGDVLLMARSGGSRPIEERFYFSNRYRSWHGSADAQDSRIPILVAHGRDDGEAIRSRVESAVGTSPNQEDIAALILALLGR
jgi:hypothetical protein